MAVDILSRGTQTPIIVGDKADLSLFQRCAVEMVDGTPYLTLSDDMEATGKQASLHCAISRIAGANLLQNEFVLLVGLTTDDQIAHAVLTPVNDNISAVRFLSEPEIKQIAEVLVAGDFQLDFLR